MNFTKAFLVKILLFATSASAHQSDRIQSILSPDKMVIEGISYLRVLEILGQERDIEYGEPVAVEINKEEGTVDLSDFDGRTIRIPLEQALTQPNKVDVSK